jgi:hypothetical protein
MTPIQLAELRSDIDQIARTLDRAAGSPSLVATDYLDRYSLARACAAAARLLMWLAARTARHETR